jgi:hypothetical protein
MIDVPIFSLGSPPTFIKVSTDANYYLERDAYERCYNRYLLSAAGASWQQAESADFSAWTSALNTYESEFSSWLDAAVEAQADGLPVPAPPTFPAPLPGIPWWITAIQIAITVIKVVWRYVRKRFEGGTDTSELVALLRDAMMLPDPENEGEYIPIMELLASVPLEIIINKEGQFQDWLFTSGYPPEGG